MRDHGRPVVLFLLAIALLVLVHCRKDHRRPRKPKDPEVYLVRPSLGLSSGGDVVALFTRHFTDDFRQDPPLVIFGTRQAEIVDLVTPTDLHVRAPRGDPGPVNILVRSTGSPEEATCEFCYDYRLDISCNPAISPDSGPDLGGTSVQITGGDFGAAWGQVEFGGQGAIVVAWTTDHIECIAPRSPQAGPVEVRIVPYLGSPCVVPDGYTYLASVPCSAALWPDVGPVGGGAFVRIVGAGFGHSAGRVHFGEREALVASWTNLEIFCVVPAAEGPGTVDVWITPAVGSPCVMPDAFVYSGCTIARIGPDHGPTSGGDRVGLVGTGFRPSDHLRMGDVFVDPTTVVVDPGGEWIVFETPPAARSGPVDVKVLDDGNAIRCVLPGGYTYEVNGTLSCSVFAVIPADGPASGGQPVTVYGEHLLPPLGVLFGQLPAEVTYVDPQGTYVECRTPPAQYPGVVDVIVSPRSSEPCVRSTCYSYDPMSTCTECSITSITPSTGVPGELVDVEGKFCVAGDLRFGPDGPVATIVSRNWERLKVRVPPGPSGMVPLFYHTPGGVTCSSSPTGHCFDVSEPALCFTYR